MSEQVFNQFKNSLMNMDPCTWAEKYLTLDGKPYRLKDAGYRPIMEIMRYIGIKGLGKDAKPVIIVKSRQTGMTVTSCVLEMFFMASGLFGTEYMPPMRVAHIFPFLDHAAGFSKTKLSAMIDNSILIDDPSGKKGKKPYLRGLLDNSSATNDNLQFKQFKGSNHIWIESAGLDGGRLRGKQLCLETELPTPSGFIKLKELREGDQLFDEQGNICQVIKLHPINETPEAYRIIFDDETIIDACVDHLWLTYTRGNRSRKKRGKLKKPKPIIKSTKQILNTLKVNSGKENNHSIPCTKPLNYPLKELPIDPYVLGVWLGDGFNSTGTVESADQEILNEITKSGYSVNLLDSSLKNNSKSNSHRIGEVIKYTEGRIGELTKQLKELNLLYNKHIPDIYLRASYQQRLDLCQGLMDTDASCDKGGRIEYTSTIPQLANDVLKLLLSLGIKAHKIENESWLYDKKCVNRFRLNFVTRLPVFRLSYKLERIKKNDKAIYMSTHRFIKNIIKIPSKPMRCITVDSPSNLFLITRNFIPTHNTTDAIFFDECQDINSTAIANSVRILTKAQYGPIGQGVQVYFGTPKQKGSDFWKMWQQSSQQYYHLGCERCNKQFPLYTPGSNDWESTWLYDNVVKCTHCGCEQDRLEAINRGKWVATKDPADAKFIGFHINQLYLPEFTKEKIIDAKPENSPINTERAYQNEILGEFFQGEAGIISPDEIREKCGDPERKFKASITAAEEITTFLGIDIGAKADLEQLANSDKVRAQGQSYSTAVVLSLSGPGRLSIEYAFKFKRNDLESKKSIIDETIKRYNTKLAICDIGFANDFNEIMQTSYGDRFLSSQASGKVNDRVKYNADIFPKIITFERDFWIMELYEQMRKGLIRFPLGSYEQVAWLMQHCSNMEIKPSISRSGDVSPHYVKSGANDGFAALLNGYIAYKFYISKGFQVKNPLLQNDNPKRKPSSSVIAVYSSR